MSDDTDTAGAGCLHRPGKHDCPADCSWADIVQPHPDIALAQALLNTGGVLATVVTDKQHADSLAAAEARGYARGNAAGLLRAAKVARSKAHGWQMQDEATQGYDEACEHIAEDCESLAAEETARLKEAER